MSTTEKLPKSLRRGIMRAVVRGVLRPMLGTGLSVPTQRRVVGAITAINRPPRGVTVTSQAMDGVPAIQVSVARQKQKAESAILYLHGGAYVLGAAQGYRNVAGHIAVNTGADVFCADYRMAPEHPYPLAVDDAVAAYRWLLAQGYAPQKIAIAGDSAGGGLALASALALRDQNVALPAALVLISPWVDLTLSGESVHIKTRVDAMLRASWLTRSAQQYMQGSPLDHPGGSPLFADLTGMPPMIIHTGSDEILLDDSKRLAERAQAAGVAVNHKIYANLWHVFHIHAGLMPEADAALDDICTQLNAAWRTPG